MGNLSAEQIAAFTKWLADKWAKDRAVCTVCGINNWQVAQHLVSPPVVSGRALSLGGPAYPQAMCICRNCGHTLYFNAVVAGIHQPEKPFGRTITESNGASNE